MDGIADDERSSGKGVVTRDGEELVSAGGVGGSSCFQVGGEATRHVRADADVSNHMKITHCCCVYSPE